MENRQLGVETNITNWQRRQNANNNFSAVVPYDMELQRKESKEFLDDLTTRDQRMMFAVMTLAITADTKEQLDSDTEAVLSVARKHMCQLAVLKFQQLDGLNTALPIGARKINAFRTSPRNPWPYSSPSRSRRSRIRRHLLWRERHFPQPHHVQQGEPFEPVGLPAGRPRRGQVLQRQGADRVSYAPPRLRK